MYGLRELQGIVGSVTYEYYSDLLDRNILPLDLSNLPTTDRGSG